MNTSNMPREGEQTALNCLPLHCPLLFGRLTREEAQRQMNEFAPTVDKEWGSLKTELGSILLQIWRFKRRTWAPKWKWRHWGDILQKVCCLRETEAMITSLEPEGFHLKDRLVVKTNYNHRAQKGPLFSTCWTRVQPMSHTPLSDQSNPTNPLHLSPPPPQDTQLLFL